MALLGLHQGRAVPGTGLIPLLCPLCPSHPSLCGGFVHWEKNRRVGSEDSGGGGCSAAGLEAPSPRHCKEQREVCIYTIYISHILYIYIHMYTTYVYYIRNIKQHTINI